MTSRKNLILLIIAFVMFMEAVDTTIINTAIPTMASSLQVNPIDLKIALISYLLSLAIFIPISGWIADRFGIKEVFIAAITIFTLSSIWCGFTQNLPELVFARIFQGLGGALSMPLGRLIILRTHERHEYISKMNVVVMVGALGIMMGPVLGGIITTYFSWRWIFWVNIPMGLITIIAAYFLIDHFPPRKTHSLDKIGFILFGSGLALLTLGFSLLSESNVSEWHSVIVISIAVFLLLIYFMYSRNKSHPIVQNDLFAIRTFRIAVFGSLVSRMTTGGVPFLMPLLLQIVIGYSPQTSGFLLAPIALGIVLVKPFALIALRMLGYRKLLILNSILLGLMVGILSFITVNTHFVVIGFLMFLFGFLLSLQFSGVNSLAYAEIAPDKLSSATSIVSTIQQLGQSFGVALAAILIRFFAPEYPHYLALNEKIFQETFLSLCFITLLAAIVFFQLKPDDGHELIDRHEK